MNLFFECSGQQKAADDADKILKPGGKLVLVRNPPEGKYVFNMDLMRRKEIAMQNVRRQNHCVKMAVNLSESGLPVEQLVTHYFKPEEMPQTFEMVANYEYRVIKVMIDF
jgi:threonine dehydrogenase-like Zn-dependent dehydrogenase